MLWDQLSKVRTRSPLQVSLIFALGILLPSGFLTFLGLRSYRYEARMMERETEERFTAVGDLVEKRVSGKFTDLLAALQRLADQSSVQRLQEATLFPVLLAPQNLENIPIENLFVFNDADRMIVPWHADVNVPGHNGTRHDVDWGPLADEIDRLERLEFAEKNVAGALRGYLALQSRPLEPAQRITLMKNIAGNYRKLRQYAQAVAVYEKLALHDDQTVDFSGYPVGIIARQTIVELYDEQKASVKSLSVRLDLYEGLLKRRWSLSPAQRKSMQAELRPAIEHMVSARRPPPELIGRWNQLQAYEARLKALEAVGARFASEQWPDLLKRARGLGRLDQGTLLQTQSGHPSVVMIVPIRASQGERRRGLLVAALPVSAVWPVIHRTMEESAGSAVAVEWSYNAPSNRPAAALWRQSLQREIRVIDPPLVIRLMDRASSTRDELFRRRQWIFGGMVGLSFIVIVVGLVIMAKAVKRETEVANLKADFVANVSHELRTPLAAISHIGERLSLGRYRSDEERKEFYDLLGKETGRLRTLIEDILDFSKILAGKKVYRQERLDLNALVTDAVATFRAKAEGQGFQLEFAPSPSPIPVLGDPLALTQAVLNLMDNAVKYSGASRRVDVLVSLDTRYGRVSVRDYGVGIPEADKEKIFEKFYRLERPGHAKDEGGVGLGLAMVKHVAEGHRGKIEVASLVGQGSTFSLLVPLAQINGGEHGSHSGH